MQLSLTVVSWAGALKGFPYRLQRSSALETDFIFKLPTSRVKQLTLCRVLTIESIKLTIHICF